MKWVYRLSVISGAVCLLLLAAVNGEIFDLAILRETPHQVQFGLLVVGVVLLGVGGGSPPVTARWRSDRVLLVALVLVGFGLRVWNLERAVFFYTDEGNFVEGILQLWERPNTNLMSPFNYIAAFTWVYPYLQMGSVAVFGPNLLALRVVSAAFGTLTIPAVYALGRGLFGRNTALLAALLLAVYPPHIHLSRLGLNNIADPLFGTLALALLVRGGRWSNYVLAGVMLGLTQYFYEGGRLLYPALALVWGLVAWRGGRVRLAGLALAGGMAAWVAFPVYFTLAAWDISFTARLRDRGLNPGYWGSLLLSTAQDGYLLGHLREQILPPFLHFVSLPDKSQFYYGGHTALVLPHLVPVFFVGLAAGLRRYWLAGLLPLLWIVFTALGNSLILQNAWSARYVVAFPAVALLLAVGLRVVLAWMNRRSKIRVLAPVVVAVVVLSQVVYYFGPHLAVYQYQIRPQHDQQDIVRRVRDLPERTQVYLITDDSDIYMPLLVFLSRFWGMPDFEMQVRHPTRIEDWEALENVWWGVDHAFFVEQNDLVTQSYLREKFGFDDPGSLSAYPVPVEKQYLMLYYQPAPPMGQ